LVVTAQEVRIFYRSASCFAGQFKFESRFKSWCKAR
jgi:hypothetical protein